MSVGVILTIVFVVLKLLHDIDWSWWWVISPVFFEIALDFLIFGGVLTAAVKLMKD